MPLRGHPVHNYAWKGDYFITICTKNREHFLGAVEQHQVHLSLFGKVARYYLLSIPKSFAHTVVDEWTIMPNHVHLLLRVRNSYPGGKDEAKEDQQRFGLKPLATNSVSSIINHFKGNVKRWCNQNGYEYFQWQSRFHDSIIRNKEDLWKVRQYIRNNVKHWADDALR